MRIISGTLKSRFLYVPKTLAVRPVTDRAKETLFNVLGGQCESAVVLDLFAGSGSLGLEAFSRGATEVYFVDSSRIAAHCIERNLERLSIKGKTYVYLMPVSTAIERLRKQGRKFDLIFLDPPHNKGLIKKSLHHLDHSDIVTSLGTIVIGHSNLEGLPKDLATLCHQRSIKIGQTFVSFLTKSSGQ